MRTVDHIYSDEELLIKLQNEDISAFNIIYNKHWKTLYQAAYKRVDDEEVAKDIIQNVFIDIWFKRNSLQINTTLVQYLHGAVKMKVLNHFRSENIKQQVLDGALERISRLLYTNSNLSGYFDLERIINEEVDEMPANMKNSFLLRSDSYSIKEIAGNLNLAEQTVSNNISEAFKRLKKRLKVEYPERYTTCFAVIAILLTKS